MRPQILKYYFARSADVEEGGSSMGRSHISIKSQGCPLEQKVYTYWQLPTSQGMKFTERAPVQRPPTQQPPLLWAHQEMKRAEDLDSWIPPKGHSAEQRVPVWRCRLHPVGMASTEHAAEATQVPGPEPSPCASPDFLLLFPVLEGIFQNHGRSECWGINTVPCPK